MPPERFVLVAGEASGDQLGAALLSELRQRYPQAQFAGIGGEALREAGLECWWDSKLLAVMGLAEVVRHLPRLLRLRRELVARCIDFAPSCYIGIDAPDFNLGVERRLKQRGVTTVHYVSPSVWAWRQRRAAKLGRCADLVLCLFPFEPPLYARFDVRAEFVGHPLADQMPLMPDRAAAKAELQLPDKPFIAVLPGSRISEVERLGPVFARAIALLKQRKPALEFISPAANPDTMGLFVDQLNAERPGVSVYVRQGDSRQAMIASELVLLASGTAALEAALAKRPMVVGYRVAGLTYRLVKLLRMLKVSHYCLPNALAGKALVPELMQHDFVAEQLADEVIGLLEDEVRVTAMVADFEQIHRSLGGDCANRAATAVGQLLEAPA